MGNLPMAHLKNSIFLLVIHERVCSKACLSFFKNVTLPMHQCFLPNVPNSNVLREQLIVVATESFTTNLILSRSNQTWKLSVRLVVSKLYSSQNSTVKSISLSSAGGMQSRYTATSLCLQRRLILKQMSLRHWNQCH